jgi:hypothetical protein
MELDAFGVVAGERTNVRVHATDERAYALNDRRTRWVNARGH